LPRILHACTAAVEETSWLLNLLIEEDKISAGIPEPLQTVFTIFEVSVIINLIIIIIAFILLNISSNGAGSGVMLFI
jgi:hypothetical protein